MKSNARVHTCLGLLSLAVACPAVTGQAPAPVPAQVLDRLKQSLVHIDFWVQGDGNDSILAGQGTGFVVVGPDKKRWIATASHGVWTSDRNKPIVSIKYRHQDMPKPSLCGTPLIDEAHDIAMLSPSRLDPLDRYPALEWAAADPAGDEPLIAVGSPSGLEFDGDVGYSRTKPLSVTAMAKSQNKPLAAFAPMKGDLTFVRHNIPIAGGYSGGPVVSLRTGKVVGLQSSTLKDAAFVAFAVHRQHFDQFNWKAAPRDLREPILVPAESALVRKAAPAVAFKATLRPAPAVPAAAPPPAKVKLGGIDVEAPFIHHGYIEKDEKDARRVIEKYVEDKDWYLTEKFGGARLARLQDLLDRTQMARISNPLLGFEMLVPKGYTYSAQPTDSPNGLLVTLRPGRKPTPPYDWPLSIWVTIEPDLFVKGRADFTARLELKDPERKLMLTEREKTVPAALAALRDQWVNAYVADQVAPRFANRDLGLRTKAAGGDPKKPPTFLGPPKAPLYDTLPAAGEGRWLRSNYAPADQPKGVCHNVRLSGRAPRAFVVHYQYAMKDIIAFTTGEGECDPTAVEYAIIASTVSVR